MKIIIITGNKSSGKSKLVGSLILKAANEKLNFDGIISRAIYDLNGEKTGFEAVRLYDDKSEILCHTGLVSQTSTFKYGFNTEAFSLGDIFDGDAIPEVFFLDEIGVLEAANQGWSELLDRLLKSESKVLVLSLRFSVLRKIIDLYNLKNPNIYPLDSDSNLNNFADEIFSEIKNN